MPSGCLLLQTKQKNVCAEVVARFRRHPSVPATQSWQASGSTDAWQAGSEPPGIPDLDTGWLRDEGSATHE